MRLTSIEIRDFRSVFVDDQARSLRLDLGTGMNTFVGRNNCGKSNVLRAVSLALDSNHEFDHEIDIPGPRSFSHPTITLRFAADGGSPEEHALLDAARGYEESVSPTGPTFADEGLVALRVSFPPEERGYRRREQILTPSKGTKQTGDLEALAATLQCLREAMRFMLISSGESIESVLEGNFREILHSVIRDHLTLDFRDAEVAREFFIDDIEEELLVPLKQQILVDLGQIFPEIGDIGLIPEVPDIETILAKVRVTLEDAIESPLAHKGTGIRGGLLAAMLHYLAEHSTRGMVFAVEEPEAFLHPEAQEGIRDQLEDLATNPDVTLLVTTHSPFILSRSPVGRVFALGKDRDGRTRISESAAGDAPHTPLVGDLFGETTFDDLLDQATVLPPGTKAVVLVEGDGDCTALRLAVDLVGRPDLLEGIHLEPAGGATKIAVQAVVARAAADLPVMVVLDNDEPGRMALDTLVKKLGFQKNREVVTYRAVFPDGNGAFPYEAEDLFDPNLIKAFVEEHGDSIIEGSRKRPDEAFHYDFSQAAKELLDRYLQANARPEHVRKWLELLLVIREELGFGEIDEGIDELIASAPERATTEPEAKPSSPSEVLVVTGGHEYGRYLANGVVVLDEDTELPDGVTHLAFYSGGDIEIHVPAVLADYPALQISEAVVEDLRATGREVDQLAANSVAGLLDTDMLAGDTVHLVLLSYPNDERTLRLDQPIKNTKKAKSGRPMAWTVGSRLTDYAALAKGPKTTDELEALGG